MKYSVSCLVPVTLLLTAGCTEILNIDVHYLSGGGGSGAGPSNGGNGASVSDGGSGAGSSDGGNGAGGVMGTGGDPSGGGGSVPSLCTFNEEFETPPKPACWSEVGAEHAMTLTDGGDYNIVPHRTGSQVPPGHGWYNDDEGYLLYHSVAPGPFAVVTRVRATAVMTENEPNPSGTYHMAGLILRDPDGGGQNNESWAKFEVGYRQSMLTQPSPEPVLQEPIGVLSAVTRGDQTLHLTSYEGNGAHVVELGVCRDSFDALYFYHRPVGSGPFQLQEDQGQELMTFELSDTIDIGLTAGAFSGPAVAVKGRFEFIRFAEVEAMNTAAQCEALLENLVTAGPDPSCECE
jgi:hypothetical protein